MVVENLWDIDTKLQESRTRPEFVSLCAQWFLWHLQRRRLQLSLAGTQCHPNDETRQRHSLIIDEGWKEGQEQVEQKWNWVFEGSPGEYGPVHRVQSQNNGIMSWLISFN